MRIFIAFVFAIFPALVFPQSINKCIINGKPVIQDSPCPSGAQTAKSMRQESRSIDAQTVGADTQRQKEFLIQGRHDRAIRDLEYRITQTEESIYYSRAAMDSELSALRSKKLAANNNLAGAVWEQSISQEMSAITDKHGADIRVKQDALNRLRKELDDMRKPKPQS